MTRLRQGGERQLRLVPRAQMPREGEAPIMARIIKTLNAIPWVWVWRCHTGATKIGGRYQQFGVKGQSDVQGIVQHESLLLGVPLHIEVKSPSGRVSLEQQAWIDRVRGFGGVAGVARSVDEAVLLAWEARRK